MSTTTLLGPGGEFDAIRELLARWGDRARGVGDDAAVLEVPAGERLIVSTDSSVEGVHFRRDWLTPREIGYRATVAALSDLAAMAATPLGMLIAIAVPAGWRADLGALADGIGDAAALCDVPIVGGDLARAAELSITVTVMGSAVTPLTRSGARPGDRIWITGTLGGPARAIAALAANRAPDAASRERFAHPVPRLKEARWLAARGATAGMDISDGLVADAGHLAAASGVRVSLDLDRVPHVEGSDALTAAGNGEEYELLIALPASAAVHDFQPLFRLPLTEIGIVGAVGHPAVETTYRGARVAPPRGYDHFS
jgi:thiamine-monophosphate kinase